jgi:hypothetical protein
MLFMISSTSKNWNVGIWPILLLVWHKNKSNKQAKPPEVRSDKPAKGNVQQFALSSTIDEQAQSKRACNIFQFCHFGCSLGIRFFSAFLVTCIKPVNQCSLIRLSLYSCITIKLYFVLISLKLIMESSKNENWTSPCKKFRLKKFRFNC